MERSSGSTEEVTGPGVIGLLAGAGALPREAARLLRTQGRLVRAIAFAGIADQRLAEEVDAYDSVVLGQLSETRAAMRKFDLDSILLVGKVPKAVLRAGDGLFKPDAEAIALLSGLGHASDESLLGLVGQWLDQDEIQVERQDHALAPLLAGEGVLFVCRPSEAAQADLVAAKGALSALGREGSGQCVVMAEGNVIAHEEDAGTDDAIRRAGLAWAAREGASAEAGGLTVVKAARPGQDRRFDLPAVGPETLRAMRDAGATALAVEAGATLIIDRDVFRREAEKAGIAVWGFDPREAIP